MSKSNDVTEEILPVDIESLKSTVLLDTCKGCGRVFDNKDVRRSTSLREYCTHCATKQRSINTEKNTDNSNWLQVAEEAGVPLWEQQPNETADEYAMWCAYRDLWPAVRPTITKVAKVLQLSSSEVQRAFRRWTWTARLQAWIKEVNADRTAELRQARRRMVEDHISIGEKLRKKALKAVDNLDEYDVTPNELVQLLKLTQQFEETARDAMDAVEQATAQDIDEMNPNGLFVASTGGRDADSSAGVGNSRGITAEDAKEVMKILAAAGVVPFAPAPTQPAEVVIDDEL